ncbi:MAG: T9SS type A sorting domain-containing protein [Ignavibacteria bacterium]
MVNEELPAGSYKYQWNASGLASGVYFYRLQAGNFIDTRKLILMK